MELFQYHLQPGRWIVKSDGNGTLEEEQGFSVMGISVAGGVFHNVGQLIVAMLVVETFSVGYYFPVLLVAGLITGLVIGIVSAEMLKRIKNIQF